MALFTAVSAVCVTGLAVVDTGSYWSPLGQSVVLALIQVGGFGLMTAAALLGLMVNRGLRLRTRLLTQAENHSVGLGDVATVARLALAVTLVCEAALTLILALRFHFGYGMLGLQAVWFGLFHAACCCSRPATPGHWGRWLQETSCCRLPLPRCLRALRGSTAWTPPRCRTRAGRRTTC